MTDVCRHYFHVALELAERKGLSIAKLCEAVGIMESEAYDHELSFSSEQLSLLWRYLCVELEDEFLGFTNRPCKIGVFFTACKLARHSPNLHYLLRDMSRIYELIESDVSIDFVKSGDGFSLTVANKADCNDIKHFITEFTLFNWHRLACWFTDTKIKPLYATFKYEKPDHADIYEQLFQCQVYFNGEENSLVFDDSVKHLQPMRSRKEVYEFLNALPICSFSVPGKDNSVEGRVVNLITRLSKSRLSIPSLDIMAFNLNMSRTTLSRKLAEENTSYSKLKEFVRRELVEDKLRGTNMTISQISDFVGFSEPASLNRAFKRWTGQTPRQFRKMQRS